MAAVAHPLPQARRRHQQLVAALLDQIEERRRRLYALQAGGALPAGLRDLKAELRGLQRELAVAVDARLWNSEVRGRVGRRERSCHSS